MGTGRILTFVRAVAALGLTDRDSLYWAGRTTMIARRDDLESFDEAFDDWYRSLRTTDDLRVELNMPGPRPTTTSRSTGGQPDDLEVQVAAASEWHGIDDDEEVEPGDESSIRIVASGAEVLRSKSFGELTDEERERVAALIRVAATAGAGRAHAPDPPGVQGGAVRSASHAASVPAHAGRAVRPRMARAALRAAVRWC